MDSLPGKILAKIILFFFFFFFWGGEGLFMFKTIVCVRDLLLYYMSHNLYNFYYKFYFLISK